MVVHTSLRCLCVIEEPHNSFIPQPAVVIDILPDIRDEILPRPAAQINVKISTFGRLDLHNLTLSERMADETVRRGGILSTMWKNSSPKTLPQLTQSSTLGQ